MCVVIVIFYLLQPTSGSCGAATRLQPRSRLRLGEVESVPGGRKIFKTRREKERVSPHLLRLSFCLLRSLFLCMLMRKRARAASSTVRAEK